MHHGTYFLYESRPPLIFGAKGGSYVDLGNPGLLQITSSMSVSAWINSSAFPADDAAIVSKRTGASEIGYQLDTTTDMGSRTIAFKLTGPQGGKMFRYGATTLQPNTWYHVAGVYDAQAQTLNVYLNGVLDNGQLLGTVAASQLDSPLNANIGRRPGLDGYEFLGTIDEVRVYSRSLTQAEIQADMSAPASGGAADTTPPSAPAGLSATTAGSTQINLTWTASTDNVGVTGYRVERCQGAGCGSFAEIGTPAGTTFSDAGLAAGTSYSYRVRAADAAGNLSAYSNVASATTLAGQAQMYFIEPDHLNTPRMISSSTSTTVWRWDQGEPFGNDVPNNNPSGAGTFDFPLRFPGQYFDRETNLAYNLRRDYDAGAGRYIQSDPIGLRGGLNTYAYVSGSPLSFVDPEGLLNWFGKYRMGSLGIGKLGGFKAHFELESECDVDGMKGFATVDGYGATVGIGSPGSGVWGEVKFVDGNIRVDPNVFNGRLRVNSIGIQIGPWGFGKTSIFLGGAVSTDVDDVGIDAGISFGIGGFANVTASRKECCKK